MRTRSPRRKARGDRRQIPTASKTPSMNETKNTKNAPRKMAAPSGFSSITFHSHLSKTPNTRLQRRGQPQGTSTTMNEGEDASSCNYANRKRRPRPLQAEVSRHLRVHVGHTSRLPSLSNSEPQTVHARSATPRALTWLWPEESPELAMSSRSAYLK